MKMFGEDSNLLWVWILIPIFVLGLFVGLGFYLKKRLKKDDQKTGINNIEDHIKSST